MLNLSFVPIFFQLLIPFFIFFFTRVALVFLEIVTRECSFGLVMKIFSLGVLNDLLTLTYLLPGLIIINLILKKLVKWPRVYLNFLSIFYFLEIFFFGFTAFSEFTFWQEFYSRFNFIAVDYLIYTKEVASNIKESFNLPFIFLSIALVSGVASYGLVFCYKKIKVHKVIPWWGTIGAIFLPLISFQLSSFSYFFSLPTAARELSKNGAYEIFSAYRNNQIDFSQFYATVENQVMNERLEMELAEPNKKLELDKDGRFIKVAMNSTGPIKKNVIIVAVESLGANFLGSFGNNQNITPKLDKLESESLVFKNLYATGTRTVRGLEAITLSLPPTPGASIVRRPHNENLMSVGSVFAHHGYVVKFIYGGRGIFDNMNNYFSHNHYQIVDQGDFDKDEIRFSNAWGVCDQDLFAKVIKEADLAYQKKQPFHFMALTTSNHRPFTYPDGVIDIPSHTGREGAVKYTDFAIGELLEKAKSHPWFRDTVFVIVADHSAEGRGRNDIPVETYHIPMFFYAPGFIAPQRVTTVASQIDLAPTLFSLLKFPDQFLFLGKNILEMKENDQRFFSGTYQKVGFYKSGEFISLGPKKTVEVVQYDPINRKVGDEVKSSDNIPLAISYYQYANYLYGKQLYHPPYKIKED